jgi:DNA topoisomerase-3
MNKLETPNEKLAAIVGSKPLNRPTIVKKVWEYIKKNGLQAGRNINPDATLAEVTGSKTITMFQLAGCISKNLVK